MKRMGRGERTGRSWKKANALLITAVAAVFAFPGEAAFGCTVAVISGKATPDGRPLLWKNRDSTHPANRVMSFREEGYAFLGLVNSEDAEGKEVWAGVNSEGFCIMNSASYNVNVELKDDEERRKDEEGLFMKQALGECATVEDFERLLAATSGYRGLDANFGVIDAHGGAAFFEVDNQRHVRYDAGDPRVSPEGYIVRTNYSYSGTPHDGAGYIRFDRASKLFHEASSRDGVSSNWLLATASRDMVNGLTQVDPLAGPLPVYAGDRRFFYMSDSITRNTATATILFQGVKAGDDPAGTIMWTRLGHPLCSVALPLWVLAGDDMPLVAGSAEENAPIDRFALYWWERLFPLRGGSRDRYLDLAPVVNRRGDGILPRLVTIEQEILRAADAELADAPADGETLKRIQREIGNLARDLLRKEFPQAAAASGLE